MKKVMIVMILMACLSAWAGPEKCSKAGDNCILGDYLQYLPDLNSKLNQHALKQCPENEEQRLERLQSKFDKFKKKVMAGKFAKLGSANSTYYYRDCENLGHGILSMNSYLPESCQDFERSNYDKLYLHEYGQNRKEIQAKLSDIISQVKDMEFVSEGLLPSSMRFVADGFEYEFDLSKPILANPTYRRELVSQRSYVLIEESIDSGAIRQTSPLPSKGFNLRVQF